MSNNLIIINAHIVTPQGRTARKGEAMNELLNIPCGTVRVTDGIITYVGENRISHEKLGYKTVAHFHASGFKQGEWHDMIWMEKTLCPHPVPPLPFIPFPEL